MSLLNRAAPTTGAHCAPIPSAPKTRAIADPGAVRTSVARPPSNQDVIDAAINRLVAAAPPLTREQIRRLEGLLGDSNHIEQIQLAA